MRYSIVFGAATAITAVNGITLPEIGAAISLYSTRSLEALKNALPTREVEERSGGGNSCPAVWTSVVKDLTTMFLDTSNGQCNNDARAAIREAFHDCGTWDNTQGATGGCDGSLILAQEAYNRPENNGLQDISNKLLALQQKYPSTTVADVIQVAASVAIVTCPGGPRITTYVGRKDNATLPGNPNGNLPDAHASGDSLYALFQAKGFNAVDLAALLGAHSTSKAFGQPDIPSGGAQDSTPGLWDVKYYGETIQTPAGVYPFQSDKNLAAHAVVGKEFSGFVNNQGKWTGKFADAMTRMSLLGVPGGSKNLIDCTNVIPKGTNNKRDMRAAPINDRVR